MNDRAASELAQQIKYVVGELSSARGHVTHPLT